LTKSDLIAELAVSNPHLRRADIELIVSTIFDQISEALAHGGRVELRGLPEKPLLHFKTGRKLHGRLNRKPTRPASAHSP
jgi:nucleoid DNA-binding protein